MDFQLLQMRLISHVKARVRNGELSERSLARLTGISQPHIHNVLKGARLLSPDLADQVLQRMHIDLVDLLTAAEGRGSRGAPSRAPAEAAECRAVALLDGWIGRGFPYPQVASRTRYPFLAADVDCLESPVAARLAPDPLREPIFGAGGVVLLDCSARARSDPDEGYFALDIYGGGAIGLVRRTRRQLYLWVRPADTWEALALPDRDPTEVIQGRVSLVVRQM